MRPSNPTPFAWLLTALVLVSVPASAQHRRRSRTAPPPVRSASVGFVNGGRLENGVRLEEGRTIRHLPGRPLHFGTEHLVGLIRRAADSVHRAHGGRLTVGDLSARHGGPVGHHASHQNGRDADLVFYAVDGRGRSVAVNDYVGFTGDGRAMESTSLHFDTARNWALIEALVNDPSARVEHVFISHPLRRLLLQYGRSHGASAQTLARAEAVMHQPIGASAHANHFHIRIACAADDRVCLDGIRPPVRRPQHRRSVTASAAHTRRDGARTASTMATRSPAPAAAPSRSLRDDHSARAER